MPGKLYYYNNFDVDVNSGSFYLLIGAILAGVLIGILGSLVIRSSCGRIVKALLAAEANSEASAKTLTELGLGKSLTARMMLRTDSALAKVLRTPEDESLGYAGKSTPGRNTRFYLPEENRITASLRFSEEKHPIRDGVLSVILIALVFAFTMFVLPELLQMLDNLITQFSSGN